MASQKKKYASYTHHCSVPSCRKRTPTLFIIPEAVKRDEDLVIKWNEALQMDCLAKGIKLCKKHFAPKYILRLNTGRHRLHPNAFPISVIDVPASKKTSKLKASLPDFIDERAYIEEDQIQDRISEDNEISIEEVEADDEGIPEDAMETIYVTLEDKIDEDETEVEEIGSQCHHVTGDDHETTNNLDDDNGSVFENDEFEDNQELREDFSEGASVKCDSDHSVNVVCGLPSLEHLNYLCKEYTKLKPDVQDIRARIIMTMMMLKQNLSYDFLGILFRLNSKKISYTVKETLPVLSDILSPTIIWPDKNTNQRLPICFSKFKNIRAIVECMEVIVEKPNCVNCEQSLFSEKKLSHVVKFIVAVSPSGPTIFISDSFGGATENTKIIESSGFIGNFEEGDSVMADQELLIGLLDLLQERGVQVYKSDSKVHADLRNKKIKQFKVYDKMPFKLLPYINDINKITYGIMNLSNAIFDLN